MGETAQAVRESLRQRQSLFVVCLGQLFAYAASKKYELTLGEGYVQSPRKTRQGEYVSDGVHMLGSLHYVRLAQDLNLFIDGAWISSGSHLAWHDLGDFWEKLSPLCRWGGRFKDANHFSISYDGKA